MTMSEGRAAAIVASLSREERVSIALGDFGSLQPLVGSSQPLVGSLQPLVEPVETRLHIAQGSLGDVPVAGRRCPAPGVHQLVVGTSAAAIEHRISVTADHRRIIAGDLLE